MIQKFLPSVINSLVKVYRPKIVGQNGIIHYVPAKCVQITYTSMSGYEHWPE